MLSLTSGCVVLGYEPVGPSRDASARDAQDESKVDTTADPSRRRNPTDAGDAGDAAEDPKRPGRKDAGMNASVDAGKNSVRDAGPDAEPDAGPCGGPCAFTTSTPNATVACVSDACELTCADGFDDCDSSYENGCEASLADVSTCGSCENDCAADGRHVVAASCKVGVCGFSGCEDGHIDCDGAARTGCERDFVSNPLKDQDGDGYNECEDDCDLDQGRIVAGACGCPSAPASEGKPCERALCALTTARCDGAGQCGDPVDCRPTEDCDFFTYPGQTSRGYYLCTNDLNADDANETCREHDELLPVRVDDSTENRAIAKQIDGDTLLGGTDSGREGDWRWVNGNTQFWSGTANGSVQNDLYTNWREDEPNNLAFEDCLTMDPDGFWNDRGCTAVTFDYVCELTP